MIGRPKPPGANSLISSNCRESERLRDLRLLVGGGSCAFSSGSGDASGTVDAVRDRAGSSVFAGNGGRFEPKPPGALLARVRGSSLGSKDLLRLLTGSGGSGGASGSFFSSSCPGGLMKPRVPSGFLGGTRLGLGFLAPILTGEGCGPGGAGGTAGASLGMGPRCTISEVPAGGAWATQPDHIPRFFCSQISIMRRWR